MLQVQVEAHELNYSLSNNSEWNGQNQRGNQCPACALMGQKGTRLRSPACETRSQTVLVHILPAQCGNTRTACSRHCPRLRRTGHDPSQTSSRWTCGTGQPSMWSCSSCLWWARDPEAHRWLTEGSLPRHLSLGGPGHLHRDPPGPVWTKGTGLKACAVSQQLERGWSHVVPLQ